MKKKLNCIMLIDDNSADNKYHQIIIKGMNITENIEVALDGEKAISFLKKENQTPPELIFLDINMPKINGWEFLEQYKHLDIKQKAKIVIVMLTTSGNPADREKAEQIEEVTGFKTKPLTEEMLTEILDKYFPDYK
jgi:CheY-like chemotaxis protein